MGNVKLAIRNRENANFILSIRLVLGVFANICLYILCNLFNTPQETDPDVPLSIQESLAEAWVGSGLLQGLRH